MSDGPEPRAPQSMGLTILLSLTPWTVPQGQASHLRPAAGLVHWGVPWHGVHGRPGKQLCKRLGLGAGSPVSLMQCPSCIVPPTSTSTCYTRRCRDCCSRPRHSNSGRAQAAQEVLAHTPTAARLNHRGFGWVTRMQGRLSLSISLNVPGGEPRPPADEPTGME